MKYFLDFEAAQFSGHIIEIGCVREDGEEFKSYLNPKSNISKFTTELTGITKEMVESAPLTEKVFTQFYNWIENDDNCEFYCYGSEDINFLKADLNRCNTFKSKAALSIVAMNLQDYQIPTLRYFKTKNCIGLKKVVAFFRGVEEVEQRHDALEDAHFLKEIFTYISNSETPYIKGRSPFLPKEKPRIFTNNELIEKIEIFNKNKELEHTCQTMQEAEEYVFNLKNIHPQLVSKKAKKRIRQRIRLGDQKPYHEKFWKITYKEKGAQ